MPVLPLRTLGCSVRTRAAPFKASAQAFQKSASLPASYSRHSSMDPSAPLRGVLLYEFQPARHASTYQHLRDMLATAQEFDQRTGWPGYPGARAKTSASTRAPLSMCNTNSDRRSSFTSEGPAAEWEEEDDDDSDADHFYSEVRKKNVSSSRERSSNTGDGMTSQSTSKTETTTSSEYHRSWSSEKFAMERFLRSEPKHTDGVARDAEEAAKYVL